MVFLKGVFLNKMATDKSEPSKDLSPPKPWPNTRDDYELLEVVGKYICRLITIETSSNESLNC